MAESIVYCGGFDADDIAYRFAEWFTTDGKGVGKHTSRVLRLISFGEDWEQAALETQAQNPASSGNGSLMRCTPSPPINDIYRKRGLSIFVELLPEGRVPVSPPSSLIPGERPSFRGSFAFRCIKRRARTGPPTNNQIKRLFVFTSCHLAASWEPADYYPEARPQHIRW